MPNVEVVQQENGLGERRCAEKYERYNVPRYMGEDIESFEELTQPGDFGIGAENYHFNLLVRCPICDHLHCIEIRENTYRTPWGWEPKSYTLSPSVKVDNPVRGICHFNLINGEYVIHADSSARKGS